MSKKYFCYLLLCLAYNYLITSYYRPYIYRYEINDFGLADIGNNISFIPGVYLLMRLFNQKYIYSKKGDILFHFIVLSFLEILSGFIPHIGTFDIKDIIGLFVGALILYFFIGDEE
jgi:glycopeptide antibiotics resistance protein